MGEPSITGRLKHNPDDQLAVFDEESQTVVLVTRKYFEQGTSAPQKISDLIFQPPKVGPVQLSPDDLLAVYHPPTQGVILVTRAQYDKGDISAPAVTFSAPQKTENLIFQAPKIGPVKLCPDDLLAVYDPPTQGVILVTRAQYDKGYAPQKTSDLIFLAPKIGKVQLSPNDLLAVYHPPTQGVILVTRSQYDKGDISAPAPAPAPAPATAPAPAP